MQTMCAYHLDSKLENYKKVENEITTENKSGTNWEQKFWNMVTENELSGKIDLDTFIETYETYYLKLYKIIKNYIYELNPRDPKWKENKDDPYDGICFESEDIQKTCEFVISEGKAYYDVFCNEPFFPYDDKEIDQHTKKKTNSRDNILYFLERGVSCGNSSCYQLKSLEYTSPLEKIIMQYYRNLKRNLDQKANKL